MKSMEPIDKPEACQRLIASLEMMVKYYRGLLDLVRQEYDLLAEANIAELDKLNEGKESLLVQIRSLESLRIKQSRELGKLLGIQDEAPRLMDLAKGLDPMQGDRFRNLHSVLDLLVRRVNENNARNGVLAQSGLNHVRGALGSIRDTLKGSGSVYQRQGEKAALSQPSGKLVSREA